MGAAISLIYTGTFPEKISRVCLIEGIVPIQDSEDKACDILRQSILQRATLSSKRHVRVEPSLEAAEEKLLASNNALTKESAHLLLKRGAIACQGGFKFTRDLRVRLPPAFRATERMVNSFISRVSCDVMLIVAESGLHSGVSDRERRQVELLSKSARSFELVRVPGTHHVHMNDPHMVNPHVLRLLERDAGDADVVKAKL